MQQLFLLMHASLTVLTLHMQEVQTILTDNGVDWTKVSCCWCCPTSSTSILVACTALASPVNIPETPKQLAFSSFSTVEADLLMQLGWMSLYSNEIVGSLPETWSYLTNVSPTVHV